MLDLIFLLVVLNVILILCVPEKVWLTIHRTVRKWVKKAVDKLKSASD